jgi:predicted pyridoxine 5'-phosphate oxidase superfamily flavin-nucleotide-binding protein
MVALTTEIRESLAGTKTLFLATSSQNRVPNVVPIGAFRLLDDETLLISDQYFNKTLQNIQENPVVALSWWGEKGGYQIKGPVTLHTNDGIFQEDVAWMKEIRPSLKPKSAVVLKIAEVYHVKPGADAGKKIL